MLPRTRIFTACSAADLRRVLGQRGPLECSAPRPNPIPYRFCRGFPPQECHTLAFGSKPAGTFATKHNGADCLWFLADTRKSANSADARSEGRERVAANFRCPAV